MFSFHKIHFCDCLFMLIKKSCVQSVIYNVIDINISLFKYFKTLLCINLCSYLPLFYKIMTFGFSFQLIGIGKLIKLLRLNR